MSEETYEGVPRTKIPWHPTIDYDKCTSCGACVDYCNSGNFGVYEFEEKEGKKRPIVKNPNNCIVLCTGCEEQCSVGAIKFPSIEETQEIIEKLQKLKLNCDTVSQFEEITKMKICVSATANNLEAQLDPRFGRCLYLVIVDSETMQFEAIPNMASGATGGAGIQAAQTIANKGVKMVITGNVGPNAFGALSAAGIEIVTGASGTVREVVEKFKRGELQRTDAPTVGGHFGMGGRGRGRGVWVP